MGRTKRADFWDSRILSWERRRYEGGLFGFGGPIQHRLAFAASFLEQSASGMRLLDLGCGTGRLFRALDLGRYAHAEGVDVSERAVAQARLGFAGDPRVSFVRADIGEAPLPPSDCVTALGLLDWLEPDELARLLSRLEGRRFLFSFSEDRPSPSRLLHAGLFRLKQRLGLSVLRPAYHAVSDVAAPLKRAGISSLFLYRHARFGFGVFISNHLLERPGGVRVEALP